MSGDRDLAQREPLNRRRVVEAAIAVADAEGMEALSMRHLADGLDVVPMALYKHVADKDDLLDGMVDAVFAEVEFSGSNGWRATLRDRAIALRAALSRHPWAIGRMEAAAPGPANLSHHNEVLRCLRVDAGLTFWTAVHASSLMDAYIYGFALQERTLPGDIPAEAGERLDSATSEDPTVADRYPFLVEIAVEFGRSGYEFGQEFEFGLDVLLDGVERLRAADPDAPGT